MPPNNSFHRIAARWQLCKSRKATSGPLTVTESVRCQETS